MRLTGTNRWGEYPHHDGGIALLRETVDAGATLIDTADVYGPHSNELLIREALHPTAGAVFVPWQPLSLSTPGSPTDAGGPAEVRRVLEPISSRYGAVDQQHRSGRRSHSLPAVDAGIHVQVDPLSASPLPDRLSLSVNAH
jgi:hypothetical protein